MTRNLGAHPAQLLNLKISKLCYSFYMVITHHNLKYCYPSYCFLIPQFQNFINLAHEFFLFQYSYLIFLQIGRNYVSIIITVISNISVLVSHNAICSGCFMPLSHGVNKKALPVVSPPPSPYQVFTRLFCCYTSNTLSIFCHDQIVAKSNSFSKQTNFFLPAYCWLVLILLFCVYVYQDTFSKFCHHKTTNSFTFACMHSFLLGLSSNHVV